MEEGAFFISGDNLARLAASLARDSRLFLPVPEGDDWRLACAGEGEPGAVPFNRYRAVQSMKAVLFEPRLDVGAYLGGGPEGGPAPPARERGRVVFGAKGCDLAALAVLDFVFRGEVSDPFYARNRDRTLIVSSDCTGFKEVCFCTLMGGAPYPAKGYDINLSPVEEGYLASTGSVQGEALVAGIPGLFSPASPAMRERVAADRAAVTARLAAHQRERGYLWGGSTKELMERVFESGVWEQEAERCVECGACNFVCPTCHCFLLSDHGRERFRRVRNWDACQYRGFARVGGGGNPRPELYQRLRNRYEKKLHFCPVVIGASGCTGCGRCVEACIGKIDMREVLKKLSGCVG